MDSPEEAGARGASGAVDKQVIAFVIGIPHLMKSSLFGQYPSLGKHPVPFVGYLKALNGSNRDL